MKIQIATFEIEIEVTRQVADVLELTLKDIINSNIRVVQKGAATQPLSTSARTAPAATAPESAQKALEMLNAVGFTASTMAMVASKVLGVRTSGKDLLARFGEVEKAALRFIARPLGEEKIWALYAAPVDIPPLGMMTAVVGLSEKNKLVILSLGKATPVKLFHQLVARGLKAKDIKLGVLSFHLGATEDFQSVFPQARVALDWQEFIDLSMGTTTKQIIKEAMLNPNKKQVQVILEEQEGPKELLTYLAYPKRLWRALRTTAAVKRIEKDLKKKTRHKLVATPADRQLVIACALARLQYHWYKIPVDAEQLSNLKYIQDEVEESF